MIGKELVVTFTRDGVIQERFVCPDVHATLKLALITLAMHAEIEEGGMLTIERRRAPTVIDRGLG
jgi:hypothetical protein